MNTSPVVDMRMHVEIHENLVPKDTLFIHGNLASSRWWHPALQVFQQRVKGRQPGALIFADWRGCGRSPAPASPEDTRMERLAQDYIDLLERLGRRHVNVVGHSTGGLIALLAMRRAPQLFHRAVLLDSVGAKGIALGPNTRAAFKQMAGDRALAATIIASTIHGPAAHLPFVSLQLGDDAFRAAKDIGLWVLDILENADYEAELRQVRHPALVLHGEHDVLLPREGSKHLSQLLTNGSFMELAGHGHCANVEDPEGFVRIAEGFLFA